MRTEPEELSPSRPAIMVVDDHRAVAELLAAALRMDGFDRVECVPDYDGIVSSVGDLRPDLALVDLYLADGDREGLCAIRALTYRGVTVLVLTASDDPGDTSRCLEAGAVTVLHKTDSFESVLESLEKASYGRLVDLPRDDIGSALEADRQIRDDRLRRFQSLTSAEAAVLRALVAGGRPQEIAVARSVSIRTIRSHIESIHRKLDVRTQLAAVALARETGWPSD